MPIIADAYLKGIRGYDAGKALDAMIATATNPAQNGVPYLLEKGYIPCDKVHEATSIALEYAADDWGTALMAKEMGRTDLYEEYMRRVARNMERALREKRMKDADEINRALRRLNRMIYGDAPGGVNV